MAVLLLALSMVVVVVVAVVTVVAVMVALVVAGVMVVVVLAVTMVVVLLLLQLKSPFSLPEEAVKRGKVKESRVRELVTPIFYARMRLGEFDPPEMNPYRQLDPAEVVESEAHRNLAVEAALKSFVLLKNNGVLPLAGVGRYHTISVRH